MWWRTSASLISALLVFAAAPAVRATPITYLISGVGSGTVAGAPFSDAAYVIRGVGDTADVVVLGGFPLPGTVIQAPVTASIEIAGVGTATFAAAATLSNTSPDAALSLTLGSPTPVVRANDLALLGYGMQSAFGPLVFSGPPFLSAAPQASDFGSITLDGSSAVTFEVVTTCGNGLPDAGEECDDGNASATDCCSPSCEFATVGTTCRAAATSCDMAEVCTGSSASCPADEVRADGAACTTADSCAADGTCQAGACIAGPRACDDHVPCTRDACDPSLGCIHMEGPAAGCLAAPKSIFMLAPAAIPGQALLGWRWANGPAVAVSDFSDPTVDSDYELCVYGGAGNALLADAVLTAGPRWSAAGTRGYRFRDQASATVARLRGGAAGKSSAVFKSRDAALRQSLPSAAPITVQLRKTGAALCLESRFETLQRSDATKLRARLP